MSKPITIGVIGLVITTILAAAFILEPCAYCDAGNLAIKGFGIIISMILWISSLILTIIGIKKRGKTSKERKLSEKEEIISEIFSLLQAERTSPHKIVIDIIL